MVNRYCRDELITKALSMAQVTQLEQHDTPNGVVENDAYTIGWLQEILDFWYHMVPFSARVERTQLNIPAETQEITVPDGFILDVKDGYIVQKTEQEDSQARLRRVSLQKWINRDLYYQGTSESHPIFYMVKGSRISVTPRCNTARNAWLWYYKLPDPLQSDDLPDHPSDYVLLEYLRIRALEWCRAYEPGTAQEFCKKIVSSMQASGLFNEPEDDEIPFNTMVHVPRYHGNTYAWMGRV
jgi:hypothetical protein